jgi:hypothetical protein
MKAFSELYEELDTTTSTNLKVAAMVRYLKSAPPADAAWATYILSGHRLKRFIGPALLYRWLVEECGLPEWLVEESRATVGDLAETIALLTESAFDAPARQAPDVSLSVWIEERLLPLRAEDEPRQRAAVVDWWRTLPYRESFLVNKFLTGSLRVGVSELLVTRALSEVLSMARPDVARRLMGDWFPTAEFWESLRSGAAPVEDASAPYPFFLAAPLEADPTSLGDRDQWQGSWWKWKIEPYAFDAVLLYAQPGHGRRSNLYTDYTFGVWSNGELVPVAKAYSGWSNAAGLSNIEIGELDRWIRSHTREKFGPVRSVEPTQVFELAYEGIAASTRHKSGIALRFPRIARRRPDKPAAEANTLADLQAVLLSCSPPEDSPS